MKKDKIYEDLKFANEFSVEDWNTLIKLKLKKYFEDDSIFDENKEILRTEIINYIRFCNDEKYLKLFEWAFQIEKACILFDTQATLKVIADSFYDISKTDLKCLTML